MTLIMQKCCIKNYFDGGHAQNRTGIQGFAILCVTIPPRGQSIHKAYLKHLIA